MVRLKAAMEKACFISFLFQFHYGTIKSFGAESKFIHIAYFNSTMVRLKAGQAKGFKLSELNFNSTMVRLKDLTSFKLLRGRIFQFHYGTIKSVRQT